MPRSTPAAEPLLGIGEVLERLRGEFEGISISKIRFLESGGLVTPARSPSGYRKFSLVDVERLRYVLRMQRDHFLPLRVIKEHVDALDRGLQPPHVTAQRPAPPRALESTETLGKMAEPTAVRMTRQELLAASGADDELISALVSYGLVSADAAGHFDAAALQITRVSATLRTFGLEPRHLRTVMASAAREVDLFAPVVKAARSARKPASAAQAEELSLQIATAVVELHGLLVRTLAARA